MWRSTDTNGDAMSLRLRRGAKTTAVPPPNTYGPTLGAPAVRLAAHPRVVSIFSGTPGVNFTQLNPANSQATNQAAITNDATGRVWFPKGTYSWNGALNLKSNTEYRLEGPEIINPGPGGGTRTSANSAVIDFNGGEGVAVQMPGGTLTNIIFSGGKIQNVGTSGSASYGLVLSADNSTVQDVEFDDCHERAIDIQDFSVVIQHCYIHHSGHVAMNSGGEGSVQILKNMFYRNLTRTYAVGSTGDNVDPGGFGGTNKTLQLGGTSSQVFAYNWVDSDQGFGPWWDYYRPASGAGALIEENVIENCAGAGIFYEASYGGTRIRRNYLKNNGYGQNSAIIAPGPSGLWTQTLFNRGQIQISCADGNAAAGLPGGIEIANNILDASSGGEALPHPMCVSIINGDWQPATQPSGLNFHHNQIWIRGAGSFQQAVGGFDQGTIKELWVAPMTFNNNDYHVQSLSNSNWRWDSGTGSGIPKTFSEWQGYGFDVNSTRAVIP